MNSVHPLSGWSVLLCKLPKDPQKVVGCAAQVGLLLQLPLAWAGDSRSPDKESRQRWRGKSGDGLGGQWQSGQARQTGCPEASTVPSSPLRHLALPSQGPPAWAPFPPDVLNLLSRPNWRQLFFLLERKGEKYALQPFPSSPPLSFLWGGDALYFQAKGGVRWFTPPFSSRKQVSQGSQLLFPIGEMCSSPPVPPPLSPTDTHLSKIAANPIPSRGVALSNCQWRNKTSLP